MKTRAFIAVAALAGAVAVLLGGAPAHAHALLTEAVPADGATVEASPTETILTFTETPDPKLSVVRVLEASGEQVEAGRTEPVPGHPTQLRAALRPLPQGTYTVSWRVTSIVDGHTTAGSVAFGVGVPAVAAGTEGAPVPSAPAPTGASIAGRWLFYVGVVLLLGAAVVGVAVASNPATVSRWLLGLAWLAAAGGVVLSISDARARARTGLTELLSSSTGHKLAVQAVAVALCGVAVAWTCLRRSRRSLAAVGVGAAAVMLARALAGHANASSVRWFTVGTQWIHLLSVGAWIGGLPWLLIALRRGDRGQGSGLGRRFSAVAAATLAVVALSGVARALDEVGGWSVLVDTNFGVTLLVKLGFFAALVTLGARNRFRHVPAAAEGRSGALRRAVGGEMAIAAGVLGATAVLAGLPPSASLAAASRSRPAAAAAAMTVTGHDYATTVRVRLVVSPGSVGANHFDSTVAVYDSGEPVPAEKVSLRFQLRDRPDVGPATLDLARAPDGRWRGSGNVLSIAGRWSVTALVQTPADAVEVPMELVTRAAPASPAARPGGERSCGEGKPDPAYTVTTDSDPDPPRAEGTTFHLRVSQEGRVVTGAKVCLAANMPDMPHPGVNTVAKEAAAGTYGARLTFSMTGAWSASVTIAEPGRPVVSVRTTFEVE